MARLAEQERCARERITADVQNALMEVHAAAQRLGMLHRELAAAQELEEGERIKFRFGGSTLFLVNLREQSTFDTAGREVDAHADYHRALVRYRTALGCTEARCG